MVPPVSATPDVYSSDDIVALEQQYLLQNYARYPLALERGKGPYVYDFSGKRYLDFISGIGVNALGHVHPRITKTIREQAGRIIHTSNLYFHAYQGRLAKRLSETSGLQRSFFCNSGTEATEGALKMMRSHGTHQNENKIEILSLENSFHGRTIGALSVTGQHKYRKDFEPLMPGVRFIHPNDSSALEQVISDKTCGILLEGIQGEGGIYSMSSDFLRRTRELCDRYNALLVFDETQCGIGRTGTYFSYQLFDPVIMPDVVIAAKPIGCGIPLGCIIVNEKAAASIGSGMHGSTFGGGALACRVALEFFDELEKLLPSISQTGAYFRMRLTELKKKFPIIKEVRGEGLMIGAELTGPGKEIVASCMKQGLLINCTHDVVLRFLPPYIIGEREVDKAMAILVKALKETHLAQQN